MKEEMKSMKDNDVWDLVELPEGVKPIGCKWIFKTKRDSKGNVERYKARLVAKGFTQKEGIDYKETFSPVSSKDSFRTIMALVAHFDLELHQMDVKTAFLNGDIDKTMYMVQPENFVLGDSKSMVFSYNKEVDAVVLDNAPQNAIYTSPSIQKEILHIFARKVQNEIRNEIGNAKFCLIVDEARDESRREQMTLVVRFVDKHGFVKERLIDVVHVKDTTSATLKQEICSLALVAAAKEVVDVHAFFQSLSNIINVVCSSCKRNDELRSAYATEISHLVATNQIETRRGANQIGTLKRSGDTRWSSHFNSICSLLRMFGATTSVLEDLATNGSTYSQRGDATYALKSLLSFDFVFILHMMKEIMGITDKLCQALQQKSQDILNAMHLVFSTKSLIQQLRDSSWGALLEKVSSFCNDHAIQIPDMGASFSDIIRSRRKKDVVTVEHHYRVDIFTSVIDFQLKELNSRISEQATELLILSTSLDPKDAFKLLSVCNICNLAKNFYSLDFFEQEKIQLDYELQHYEFDVVKAPDFQNLSTLAELCQKLTETGKSNIYPLIDRLIRLILTLPVTTATTERAFSAMKIIKIRLRNKMEDEFLVDYVTSSAVATAAARVTRAPSVSLIAFAPFVAIVVRVLSTVLLSYELLLRRSRRCFFSPRWKRRLRTCTNPEEEEDPEAEVEGSTSFEPVHQDP
nr:uncharacterized protein LOC114925379 [Arachis hypogaea]